LIILDTNVFSEIFRPRPDPRVAAAITSWPLAEVFLTAVTVAEILSGIARMPDGRRKVTLVEATEGILVDDFRNKVLPFDLETSALYADLVANRFGAGRPISIADGQIAAICRQHGATLATRNIRDFELLGLDLIDPWSG
jgi:predicted nucleic acid-binding protein